MTCGGCSGAINRVLTKAKDTGGALLSPANSTYLKDMPRCDRIRRFTRETRGACEDFYAGL
jgi:hypothetical protein